MENVVIVLPIITDRPINVMPVVMVKQVQLDQHHRLPDIFQFLSVCSWKSTLCGLNYSTFFLWLRIDAEAFCICRFEQPKKKTPSHHPHPRPRSVQPVCYEHPKQHPTPSRPHPRPRSAPPNRRVD